MKGQSAIEFVIVVSTVMLFFVVFSLFVNTILGEKADAKRNNQLYDAAVSVQEELALAQSSSDGYQRVFVLPEELIGEDYNITLQDGQVYAYTIDGSHALSLPVVSVVGQLNLGGNVLEKINGTVYLNR